MSLARTLSTFIVGQSIDDLPHQAVDHGCMLIASTLASAAFGSTLASSAIVRAIEVERGGRAESSLWFGAGERLPTAGAARVNALTSDAAASDDSDLRTIVHQGTTACACALAMAEAVGANGPDTLAAIVLGYETAGRLSTAMMHGYKRKGFHNSIIAAFAGTVAAGRLMRLTVGQMTNAIALTATSVGGIAAAANTSTVREYDAGNAAMAGVQAAQAARRGFLADEEILEMKHGFFDAFGDSTDREALVAGLGASWSILTHLQIKLVPGGTPWHAVAEAAAQAAIAGDIHPDDIATIEVAKPGFQGFGVATLPTDLIGIAHSPMYFAAAGAADRRYGWEHAGAEKINDPVIRKLLPRVRLVDPSRIADPERFHSGVMVTIQTQDGRRQTGIVYAPRGSAILGLRWADVEEKYKALMPFAGLPDGNIGTSLDVIRGFRDATGVTQLMSLLRVAA